MQLYLLRTKKKWASCSEHANLEIASLHGWTNLPDKISTHVSMASTSFHVIIQLIRHDLYDTKPRTMEVLHTTHINIDMDREGHFVESEFLTAVVMKSNISPCLSSAFTLVS
jgi:hypothetical protein